MNIENLKRVFTYAGNVLVEKEPYLSELDSLTGDGDHGVALAKVGRTITGVAKRNDIVSEKEFFLCIFDALMEINGGSAAPLWAMISDGAASGVTDGAPISGGMIADMFAGALSGVGEISRAVKGDKTLVDPLSAAADAAANNADRDWRTVLGAAAEAAADAAQATKTMPARFGRAKNLPEKGVGYLDPGAVSFAEFIKALSDAVKE